GGRYAELLLKRLDPLGELEHGDALQLLDPILCCRSHLRQSSLVGFASGPSGCAAAEASVSLSFSCAGCFSGSAWLSGSVSAATSACGSTGAGSGSAAAPASSTGSASAAGFGSGADS